MISSFIANGAIFNAPKLTTLSSFIESPLLHGILGGIAGVLFLMIIFSKKEDKTLTFTFHLSILVTLLLGAYLYLLYSGVFQGGFHFSVNLLIKTLLGFASIALMEITISRKTKNKNYGPVAIAAIIVAVGTGIFGILN